MKVLFLCGVFEKENETEILARAKRPIEYSANIFQEKLIRGFEALGVAFDVLSAPFIGSYPNASSWYSFRGFQKTGSAYRYVRFNNVWGFRNYSRARSLKKAIESFALEEDSDKLIVVYSPHTPFLEAAVHAKKKDPNIKICLIVPDLPQYMNLDAEISQIYKFGKKLDIIRFNRLNQQVDSYMLLTEHMKNPLNVGDRPYIVVEGIVDSDVFERNETQKKALIKDPELKYIVYTGKLNEKFGVKKLIEAFRTMPEPSYRLVLCGRGDLDSYIKDMCREDDRIVATGQVTPTEAHEWVLKADVLVNPRENNEEYTKYSFPSKNIEYLASGNPVVAHMLDGMPACYRDFVYVADGRDLTDSIQEAIGDLDGTSLDKYVCAKQYLLSKTGSAVVGQLRHISSQNEKRRKG